MAAGVALVPGAAFGDDRWVRMSYAVSDKDLETALERIFGLIRTLAGDVEHSTGAGPGSGARSAARGFTPATWIPAASEGRAEEATIRPARLVEDLPIAGHPVGGGGGVARHGGVPRRDPAV